MPSVTVPDIPRVRQKSQRAVGVMFLNKCMVFASCLLFAGFSAVAAQESDASGKPKKKETGRLVDFLLLGASEGKFEGYLFETPDSEPIGPIGIYGVRLSHSVRVKGKNIVLAVKDDKQESGYRAVCRIELDNSTARAIILLESRKEEIKPHLINSRDPRFVNNTTLFYNLSNTPIAVTMGKSPYLIKPGEMKITPVPAGFDDSCYFARFAEPTKNGKPSIFSSSKWPFLPSGRNYVFFHRNSESGRIAYNVVEERVPEFRP